MTNCIKNREHRIDSVDEESIAMELGIRPGDTLLAVNDNIIHDFIDYQFFESNESLQLLVRKADGETVEYAFEKDEEEPLGLRFENEFMDDEKACKNKCVFCFIDQMPKQLRKTLYFKDDDWRLSLMMGNYVTLTNVDDNEFKRIIERRVSPLYISVHTTDAEMRAMLLGRPNCEILPRLQRLAKEGISFHCQIVLCPGINDGQVLKQTLEDLYALGENCLTVAVVPVGVTQYRDGLSPLKKVDKSCGETLLDIIDEFRQRAKKERGDVFVFASDEIYIVAERQLPAYEEYGDFDQIEDGIGMYAMFAHDFMEALEDVEENIQDVGIVCGELIAPMMQDLLDKMPSGGVKAYPIENRFFGNTITVTGLITGRDVIEQGAKGPRTLVISRDCLRHGEDVFLDDVTLEEVKSALADHEIIVCSGGDELIESLRKK